MQAFKDKKGRDWTIELNVTASNRVKGLTGVDFLDLSSNPFLVFARDVPKLVDCLYVICKSQADAAGVSDEQFGEGLAGDVIEAATTALEKEYADFLPRRGDRENAKVVLQKTNQAIDFAARKTQERLQSLDISKIVESAMNDAMAGKPSGGAPESLGSTPARSP